MSEDFRATDLSNYVEIVSEFADQMAAMTDTAAEYGPCLHRPPSPGQSMCSCRHQAIEMEYALRFAELAAAQEARKGGNDEDCADHSRR